MAARLGVPHLRVPDAVPGSPFEVVKVLDVPGWHEVALWWPERRGAGRGRDGRHERRLPVGAGRAGHALPAAAAAARRAARVPARAPARRPRRGVHGPDAAEALEDAYARSRRDLPRFAERLPAMVKGAMRR